MQAYRAPLWLPDGHTQSIYPALFRKIPLTHSHSERMELPDGDFLDVDWHMRSEALHEKPLLIVSHGLEGSSRRHYVTGLIRAMPEVNALAWNYRSCSGDPNRNLRFYHSGATDDLDFVIQQAVARGVKDIYLAGFSLGGNLSLIWLGENAKKASQFVRKAVAFSVPLHLSSSSQQLTRWENRLYTHRFLQTLLEKVTEKSARYPMDITPSMLTSIRSLYDFDNVITGPLHGFKDAEEYYERNSSLYFLADIQVPTLIVNAKNDPFLSQECLPEQIDSDFVRIELPDSGGHCGFYPRNYRGQTWAEQRAAAWFNGN
ncbi:YheT family hydrolase [Aquirufa echingensis]|uniref:Alpha/beta fold hydrolase n=1 Tax=Aquirufa echingensis TaxID=3096516 RepID=A0ABW6D2E0_9BACT